MKQKFIRIILFVTLLLGVLWMSSPGLALAQDGDPVATTEPAATEPTPGVGLNPTSSEKSGSPGSIVKHTFTVTNTGTATDSFNIRLSGSSWETWASTDRISDLPAGQSGVVEVMVAIPADAGNGKSDSADLTVTSRTDPGPSMTARLVTRALLPTATTAPTATLPSAVIRPLVMVDSYSTGFNTIAPGQEFDLYISLANRGRSTASNLVVVFESADFFPRDTGGVQAVSTLKAGDSTSFSQPMLANKELAGKAVGSISVKISYIDAAGIAFNEVFALSINLSGGVIGGGPALPTATPTTMPQGQLVVTGYRSDADILQPGTEFTLELDIRNLGNSDARGVTMVLGGGSSGVDVQLTPSAGGGVSGGSGDLTNFAPLGSSNLFYIGDLPAGAGLQARQRLIVNVSTQPGAYPLKLSFVYNDIKNNRKVDDQVITLLVYSLPQVEINYYRDPGTFMAGQPNQIPLQVTNLGRKSAVLGNLKISSPGGEVMNNVALVGALEPGGYFTLDASIIPMEAGLLQMNVEIAYNDDFNQPRQINQTLTVEVLPMPEMGPGGMGEGGGMGMKGDLPMNDMAPETFWQKVLRFFKGLIGLGSAPSQPDGMMPEGVPGEFNPENSVPPGGFGG